MNKEKTKFVCTTSKKTAEKLISKGFIPIYEADAFWMFIKDEKMNFDELDHIIFSNKFYG